MLETDITKLNEMEPRRSLDTLEADIWAGVAERAQARKAGHLIVSSQAAVMAIALLGSMATGSFAAATASSMPHELSSFSSHVAFAPSTLLLGSHP